MGPAWRGPQVEEEMPRSRSAGSRAKEAESRRKLSVSLENLEGSSPGVKL